MVQRCHYPKNISYPRYGAKGLTVCDEWRTFNGFIRDIGEKPARGYQIDRIDNTKGYEPGNCKWSTPEENCTNRSSSKFIEYGGKRLTYSQWAREIGMSKETLISRIRDGWEPIKAITTPVRIRP